MLQAIQIETLSGQQGLPYLDAQAASRRTGGELSLHRREDALNQSTASIEPSRKGMPYLSSDAVYTPSPLVTLDRDHIVRSERPANIGMISLAVEFGVGQRQSGPCLFVSRSDDGRQIWTTVPRKTPPSWDNTKSTATTHFSQCRHGKGFCR